MRKLAVLRVEFLVLSWGREKGMRGIECGGPGITRPRNYAGSRWGTLKAGQTMGSAASNFRGGRNLLYCRGVMGHNTASVAAK